MPLINENGKPVEAENKEEQVPDKPMLGIAPNGDMTLFIPLSKTNEVWARGFVDVARTELMRWYVAHKQKQQEIARIAEKTGFQRFKEKLTNLGK